MLPSGEIFWGQDRLELLERALKTPGLVDPLGAPVAIEAGNRRRAGRDRRVSPRDVQFLCNRAWKFSECSGPIKKFVSAEIGFNLLKYLGS